VPALGRECRAGAEALAARIAFSGERERSIYEHARRRCAPGGCGLAVDGIKAIGHATGTTVNDVLTAAMAGALRRYLLGRDSLVDEIRVMVPYNLRAVDEPLPRELGNRFGLVYLTLPVGIAEPAGRLAEVHRRMTAIKHSREGGLSFAILEAVGQTPHQIEQSLLDVFAQKTSAVLTNLQDPRADLFRWQQDRWRGPLGPGRGNDRDGHQHLQLQRRRDRRPAG